METNFYYVKKNGETILGLTYSECFAHVITTSYGDALRFYSQSELAGLVQITKVPGEAAKQNCSYVNWKMSEIFNLQKLIAKLGIDLRIQMYWPYKEWTGNFRLMHAEGKFSQDKYESLYLAGCALEASNNDFCSAVEMQKSWIPFSSPRPIRSFNFDETLTYKSIMDIYTAGVNMRYSTDLL